MLSLSPTYCQNAIAGPSSWQAPPISPLPDEEESVSSRYEETQAAVELQRECAHRVAMWINQSAVRIAAFPSFFTSTDTMALEVDLDADEPHLFYSSSDKSARLSSFIRAPAPKHPSRSRARSRRHHHPQRLRTPPPSLYIIKEED
ncbi:hypothetical protein MKEN_00613500 [Mycena kentingensis (nom. inval.)]|nr:hypothetical protein MKEN_00613500 [Mycena kentingensis (nom. inval.)]